VTPQAVFDALDVKTIYEVPLQYEQIGIDQWVLNKLQLPLKTLKMDDWRNRVLRYQKVSKEINIAICGKYVELQDAYKSIIASFIHAGMENDVRVKLQWISTEDLHKKDVAQRLTGISGILVPGGFGERGIEGKLAAIRYARENGLPFFGICLGMQCAVIEFARNVLNKNKANSTEFDPQTPHPVIHLMETQKSVKKMGGTMRLGSYPCKLKSGTRAHKAYEQDEIAERHRHRYEVNNEYRRELEQGGMIISGVSPDDQLVEMVEIADHPWFVGCQFHPELRSRVEKAHPLFREFVAASLRFAKQHFN
jgi:CTP synthase